MRAEMTTRNLTTDTRPDLRIRSSASRPEMTSSRRTETAHGNSWLMTCRCHEPAYSMCYMELARGTLRAPFDPPASRDPIRLAAERAAFAALVTEMLR